MGIELTEPTRQTNQTREEKIDNKMAVKITCSHRSIFTTKNVSRLQYLELWVDQCQGYYSFQADELLG